MAIDRPTARVIVLDERNRVLLLLGDMGVWFMPGGGLEHGEDHERAAVRELWEETSLRIDAQPVLLPPILAGQLPASPIEV